MIHLNPERHGASRRSNMQIDRRLIAVRSGLSHASVRECERQAVAFAV